MVIFISRDKMVSLISLYIDLIFSFALSKCNCSEYTLTSWLTRRTTSLFWLIDSIASQFIYFKITLGRNKINFGFFTLSDTTIKYIAAIVQSLIICLILVVFIQISVLEKYYTEFIKYTMIFSSLLSIFFISLLFARFLLWYQAVKTMQYFCTLYQQGYYCKFYFGNHLFLSCIS